MKKLITEKILKTEERPFSDADLFLLTTRRNKQMTYLLSSYIPLAAILLFVAVNGLLIIGRNKYPYHQHELSDEEVSTFHLVSPYVCGFFFIILTAFFVRYYLQTLAPIRKDLKQRKKHLLYYIPEKTEMGLFNRYYLSSPIVKKQQVEINREKFDSILQGSPLAIEIAPHSQIVLRFMNEEKEIDVR